MKDGCVEIQGRIGVRKQLAKKAMVQCEMMLACKLQKKISRKKYHLEICGLLH